MNWTITKSTQTNESPVIVTGANGFTGRFVCLELLRKKIAFIAILRPGDNPEWMNKNKITIRFADLNQTEQLKEALHGCRALINVASIGFGSAPSIIESCYSAGIKRAIFISTTAIFTSLNSNSKNIRLEAESTIQKSNLNWTILRPTMIYGTPADRNMIRLAKWISKWPIIPIFGNGQSLQQPVNVSDVANSIVKVIDNPSTFLKAFNISGPEALTYIQIIKDTEKALNRNIIKIYIPYKFIIHILNFFESRGVFFPIKAEQIQRLNEDKSFSHSDAVKAFKYNPISFSEGIKREVKLYKKNLIS
tara:strand:+ start:3439 stop:4356 length:918 start_codon:yes stop_codon:yes gene_type:complete